MLTQWKYKVCEWFAIQGGEIVVGEFLSKYRGGKARPVGMYIYKPTKRKYDYVDYTGKFKGQDLGFCETTCFLEMLGYIRFVEVENGKSRAVRQN